MKSSPNITLLHYTAPPTIGGVEHTIYHHGRLLIKKGFNVSVISGRGETWNPHLRLQLIPKIDSQHPEIVTITRALEDGHIPESFASCQEHLYAALRAALEGEQVCLTHNVLSLHFNLPLTAAIHQLIDDGIPTRFVAWNHDFSWTDPAQKNKMHPGFPWDLLRQPRDELTYVVVSEYRRTEFAKLLGISKSRVRTIPPGVEISRFFRLKPTSRDIINKFELLEADLILLLPARITELKNIELGIQVVASLHKLGCAARLIVTGPPDPHDARKVSYLKHLEALKKSLGIEEEVIFLSMQDTETGELSRVSDDMITDLYQVCDVLFFPSKSEGFGIPLLEAGLARIPVFCSDIPPFHESTQDYVNFFQGDDEPIEIARQILDVLSQDETHALRQRVLAQYRWQGIVDQQVAPLIHRLSRKSKR
ncbi:MAG: glycosyltransferase family 4 protein [Anaerolineales bacterium]|nr:glycosyltransferase family 4 protein [Anaerolineales bacterium]